MVKLFVPPHTFWKLQASDNLTDTLERWLNEDKPTVIADALANQGGWPVNETFSVTTAEVKKNTITITGTIQFDEVLNGGCGLSSLPHIHHVKIEIRGKD